LLFLVAPALHVHPATDTLLHYISPEIEWTVVGIDERWRTGVRAVFRKRPRDMELKIDPKPRDLSSETAPDRDEKAYFPCQAPSRRRTSTNWATWYALWSASSKASRKMVRPSPHGIRA